MLLTDCAIYAFFSSSAMSHWAKQIFLKLNEKNIGKEKRNKSTEVGFWFQFERKQKVQFIIHWNFEIFVALADQTLSTEEVCLKGYRLRGEFMQR